MIVRTVRRPRPALQRGPQPPAPEIWRGPHPDRGRGALIWQVCGIHPDGRPYDRLHITDHPFVELFVADALAAGVRVTRAHPSGYAT